jgi:hypothetical protein
MSERHIPVARISAVAAVAVGAYLLVHGQNAPHWRSLAPGVEFATLRGEPYCRRGSAEIAVLRIDPGCTKLRVLHYSLEPEKQPLNIVQWQRRTGALAVFNAGQFYPDNSYMGLLVCSGRTVSPELHDRFMAALVAAPESGKHAARVLDLTREKLDPRAPGWREVAQSFMLFGRDGAVRVRKSDRVANRTLVAQDRRGWLLVITTEGGYTLWDLAQLLKHAPLGVSHAMVMDGGHEAELCVKSARFRYGSFGHWDGTDRNPESPGALAPLPAVVTVEPE